MIRKLCLTISAVSLAAVLTSCAGDKVLEHNPPSRDIGPPPAVLQEEKVAAPSPGQSALVSAKQCFQALDRANFRICSGREEWKATRVTFLADRPRPEQMVVESCIPAPPPIPKGVKR